MKKLFVTTLALAVFTLSATQLSSCKDKAKDTSTTETTAPLPDSIPSPEVQPPVVISADDSLTTMLKDATKDYPGVEAAVSNGEVTLTGTVTRKELPKLMMAVNALHPKKINQQMTLK